MSESATHQYLVQAMVAWIAERFFSGDPGLVLHDNPTSSSLDRPPPVGGYFPDVFARETSATPLIVGEAKTAHDLERKHSILQIGAFLQHCACYPQSLFVLAVPWYVVRCGRSLLAHLQKKHGTNEVATTVLEKLEG